MAARPLATGGEEILRHGKEGSGVRGMGLGIVVIEGSLFPLDDMGASDRPRGASGGLTCETAREPAKPGGHSSERASERAVKVLFRTKGAGASDDLFCTLVDDHLVHVELGVVAARRPGFVVVVWP